MKMPLIKQDMNSILNELVGKLFAFNRLLDRQMSMLEVKFVMNKTSATLHPLLAHAMPKLADDVSDYQGSRNNLTVYPETPEGAEDYNSPIDLFEKMLEFQLSVEEAVYEAIVYAMESKDLMTYAFLNGFLLKLNPYTNQMILLSDKIKMYGDNKKYWMDFDSEIDDFIIL